MSQTTCHMSVSLDGYVAGPDQSLDNPLGRGGLELHHWHIDEPLNEADAGPAVCGSVSDIADVSRERRVDDLHRLEAGIGDIVEQALARAE